MLSFQDQHLDSFLTEDVIRETAPFVYATAPTNPAVSDRYTFCPTNRIIEDMEKLGWGVVQARQQRASKRKGIMSFHMVAFQNPSIYIAKQTEQGETDICYPRIIVTNSHDGRSAFKFMVGIFRLVCSNGLVVATDTFQQVAIRHINYDFEELRRIVAESIDTVAQQIGVMNEMQNLELTEEQKRSFAISALRIRKGMKADESFKVAPSDEDIEEMLEPVREEDKGNDLWTVFNVLQERMTKGQFHFGKTKTGKARKARPITGLAKDLDVNTKLFREAVSYLPAAA